jgi:signal transduction histidine kinase
MREVAGRFWPDWLAFGQRLFLLTAIALLIYAIQERATGEFASNDDLVVAVFAGLLAYLAYAAFTILEPLRSYRSYALVAGDWAATGLFIYATRGDLILIIAVLGAFIAAGLLRLGWRWALLLVVGHGLASFAALVFLYGRSVDIAFAELPAYTPAMLTVAILTIIILPWPAVYLEQQRLNRITTQRSVREVEKRIAILERTLAGVADLSSNLVATLNPDRIMDATLDAGYVALKDDQQHWQRLTSVVLLYKSSSQLEVITYRGASAMALSAPISAQRGVLADAVESGRPVIGGPAHQDPELRQFTAFSSIQSVLAVPLVADVETFGLVVYGSNQANAFSAEHLQAVQALAVQATIALENANLYQSLVDEKERLIEIEENARKALVRDLHDIPTQTIASVAMRLGIAQGMVKESPQAAVLELESVRQAALQANEEIRHVLFALRPLALETQGIEVALKQLVDKMQVTFSQQVTLEMSPHLGQMLDENHQGTLFYLIEEAVNNARKYARASTIAVSVLRQGNTAVARVIDNGVGFDTSTLNTDYEQRGSFGMVNMRERAELIQGHLEIRSAPSKGTVVQVVVPLDPEAVSRVEKKQPRTRLEARTS